jgi:hypothetical protein
VTLSYGTAYYGLETDRALFEMAVRALTVMLSLWHHLHVTACQLDELWGFVHTKEAHLPGAKLYWATYGDAWGKRSQGVERWTMFNRARRDQVDVRRTNW